MALPKLTEQIEPEEGAIDMQAALYIGKTYMSIQHMDKVITTIAVLTKQIQTNSEKILTNMIDSSRILLRPLIDMAINLEVIREVMTGQYKLDQERLTIDRDQRIDQAHKAEQPAAAVERDDSPFAEEENILLRFLRGAISAFGLVLAMIFASLRNEFIDMLGRLKGAFDYLKSIPRKLLGLGEMFVVGFTEAFRILGSKIGNMIRVITFSLIQNKYFPVFMDAIERFQRAIRTVKEFFEPVVKIMRKAAGMAGKLLAGVGGVASFLGKITGFFSGPIVRLLGSIAAKALRFLGPLGVVVMIIDVIMGFAKGLAEGGNLYTAIREGFLNLAQGFIELPAQLVELLLRAMGLDEAAASVAEAGRKSTDYLVNGLRSIMDSVMNIWVTIFNVAKGAIRGLLSGASWLAEKLGMDDLATSLESMSDSDPLKNTDAADVKKIQQAGGKTSSNLGLTPEQITAKEKAEKDAWEKIKALKEKEKGKAATDPKLAEPKSDPKLAEPKSDLKPDTVALSKSSAADRGRPPSVTVIPLPIPSGGGKGASQQNNIVSATNTGGCSTAPLSTRTYESAAYQMQMSWQFNNPL